MSKRSINFASGLVIRKTSEHFSFREIGIEDLFKVNTFAMKEDCLIMATSLSCRKTKKVNVWVFQSLTPNEEQHTYLEKDSTLHDYIRIVLLYILRR